MHTPPYVISVQDAKKSELAYRVKLETGASYIFSLKRNRIQIDPKEGWYDIVPEEARLEVFNYMLAAYRNRSHVEGIKTAAIGVTEHGEIFIGCNSENRGSNKYSKDCAEQNMIHAFRHAHKVDQNQKLKSVYVMGGRNDGKPSIICPCGNCTDTLLSEMVGEQASVIVLPVRKDANLVRLDKGSAKFFDVPDGQGWKTTLGQLAPHQYVQLAKEAKIYADTAFDELVAHMPYSPKLEVMPHLRKHIHTEDSITAKPILTLKEIMASRDSAALSRYMQSRIYEALSNRLLVDSEFVSAETLSEKRAYIKKHITSVQVSIAKLANGDFHESIVVDSSFPDDRASPTALSLAVFQNQLSYSPVTDVWSMDLRPNMIESGRVITPSKDSIERALKRGGRQPNVQVHIIPFVKLSLKSNQMDGLISSFEASDLYPGYFLGSKQSHRVDDIVHEGRAGSQDVSKAIPVRS